MADTHIEWTNKVWNPTSGCDQVSPGCDHCYALTMAKRLKAMGQAKYQNDGDPRTSGPGFLATEHESELNAPLRWRKPAKVFVNSMSDLLHERIPDEFIAKAFAVMTVAQRHTFQVLTKRHARMRSLLSRPEFFEEVCGALYYLEFHPDDRDSVVDRGWPLPNVWLGVSVEDQKWADIRIPALLDTPAAVRFISAEPLLGAVDLTWLGGINALEPDWFGGPGGGTGTPHPLLDWVIVGGESGAGARPMAIRWVDWLVEQCQDAGVPIYVKQLGAVWARGHGADPKGGDWSHWPEHLRIRDYPKQTGTATEERLVR